MNLYCHFSWTFTYYALVCLVKGGLKPIKFGKSSEARTGEFVAALGSPLSLRNTVTVGVVSSKAREARSLGIEANEINYIQTDAAITVRICRLTQINT